MIRVLFVCLGNICRSPLAEGIFRAQAKAAGVVAAFDIDSAGTGAWHVGEPPDKRAQACAKGRGIDITALRARQFVPGDFAAFDYILAMDRQNYRDIAAQSALAEHRAKVRLMLSYGDSGRDDVPDPYHGGAADFETVFDMLDAACRRLLAEIQSTSRV